MQTGHTLTVRRAVATDRAGLAALLSDMQAHYGSPDPPGGAAEIARLLTRTGERLPFALVAERDGALLGLASLSPVLFGGAFQWMLFLKDLYVTGAARSLGVRTIALTGRDGGAVRAHCDLAICIPSTRTARIQEAHIAIGHAICEVVEAELRV